jgi:large repetitive protein
VRSWLRLPSRRRRPVFGTPAPTLAASLVGVLAVIVGTAVPITTFVASPALAAPAPVCGASGSPAVTALANPIFYIDTSSGLDATYAGYTVRAGTAAEDGLWLRLSGFTGGSVALAPDQPETVALPDIAANSSATSYLLLRASASTATPQTHTISLFRGHPSGGDEVCTRTFTYNGVAETIKALANKVTSVVSDVPATAEIGDVVNVTVTGNTGTLGAGPANDPGILSYAPNALSSFPAGAWRLEQTRMTISPDGVAPAVTYVDRLFLSGASGPNRPYTAVYRFRAIGPSSGGTGVAPVQYIASGTQVKHTDIGGGAIGSLPAVSQLGKLTLTKTATATVLTAAGGTVGYTVGITNVSTTAGRLDRLVDTLPAGATYVPGSSMLGGVAIADPAMAGATATWSGPIDVAAGTTLDLTYQVVIPGTPGTYANSVIGWYGTAQLDASQNVAASNPASVTVAVADAGGTAEAGDDAATTPANTQVSVDVLTNDTSSIGGTLTITAVGTPSSGTADVDGGSIVYTPAAGFAGTATFTYTISDTNSTDTATVTVTVLPAAQPDTYTIGEGETLNATTVLANDACTGCPVTLVTGATSGTLSLNTNGTFTFTPATSNFAGSVTFTYRVTAPGGLTADATVTIFVNDAAPDFATTPYDTNVTVAVTANDTCNGGCNFNINSDVLPQNGATSESGSNAIYNPNAGFVGVDRFSYTGTANTSATVTVLVGPPTKTATTTFGTAVSGSLADAAFLGISTVSCPGCTWAVATPPTGGTATLASNGALVYTPESTFAGADTFTYTITHPESGLAVTGTVNVTVGPSATNDQFSMLVRDTAIPVDLLANDSCPATCTVTLLTSPSTGTLTGSNGSYTYDTAAQHDIGTVTFSYRVASSVAPGVTADATVTITVEGAADDTAQTTPGNLVNIAVLGNDPCTDCMLGSVTTPNVGTAVVNGATVDYTPPAGFSGTATFTYTVTKNGRSTDATVTVTVTPDAVNDAYSTASGTAIEFDPRINDICVGCTITSVGTPDSGTATIVNGGTAVEYTPVGAATGTFTYTVTDRSGGTATATVVVSAFAPPSAVDDSTSTDAGVPVQIPVLGNDGCAGCTAAVASDPTSGTVSLRADGSLQFTPTAGFSGVATFTYLAQDSATGLDDTATVTVTVSPDAANDVAATTPGVAVPVNVLANDACTNCTVTVPTPPANGSVGISGGTITFTPDPGFQGTVTFSYTATDPVTSLTTTATVTVTVSTATDDAVTTAHDTSVLIPVQGNDNCGGCSITAVGTASSGTAVIESGQIRYTPTAGTFGLDTFTYTVSDGTISSVAQVRVLVAPPARTVTVDVNGSVSGSLLTGGACAGCVFTVVTPPADGEITIEPNGDWTYQAPPTGTPTDTVTYRITDPVSGLTTTGTLTVNVRESTIRVNVAVTNDDGGSLVASGVTLRLNGTTVTQGVAHVRAAGTNWTVDWDTPSGYAATGISCTDAASASIANPIPLVAGAVVTCTLGFDDISMTPSISVAKTAGTPVDANSNGRIDAGEQVTYQYVVTNTGNPTVTGISVADDKIPSLSCTTGSLASTATHTCTATYTFTQADVDAGGVTNVATATGTSGGPVTATDTVTVTIARTSSLDLAKVVHAQDDADADSRIGPGDTITFRITATNTGNTTLEDVSISDAPDSTTCGDLAPGDSCTLDAVRIVTQADVDGGGLANTATATATGHDSPTPFTETDSVTAAITATPPALTVTKVLDAVIDADSSGTRTVGDTLQYVITLTNTGQQTATGVTLADVTTGDSRSCPDLAPGDTCTLSSEIVLTTGMALAGTVQNDALATAGNAPDGAASLTVSVIKPIGLAITNELLSRDKAVAGPPERDDAGDTVTYRVTVTNTGLGDVTGLTVTSGAGTLDCGGVTSLAAGASVVCTVTRTLTQADVDAGTVDAGATAGGTSAGESLTASSPLSTPLAAAPAVSLAVTVSTTSCPATASSVSTSAGGPLVFCYVVTNTGNVTLTGTTISDPLLGLTTGAQPTITAGSTTLAPGGTLTASVQRTASVSRTHAVTVTASTPADTTVTATADAGVVVAAAQRAALEITGTVWIDLNRNGLRDANEPLLPGATVRLQTRAQTSLGAANTTVATTVTDRSGAYRFTDVASGSYRVLASAVANGMAPVSDTDGGSDWEVQVTVADNPAVADFAAAGAGTVAGTVTNRVTDAPIANAPVQCVWPGLDGVAGTADDVTFTATTDAAGRYQVDGAPYGSLSCRFTDPVTRSRPRPLQWSLPGRRAGPTPSWALRARCPAPVAASAVRWPSV